LLFSRGRLAWVRDAWQSARIIPLISRDTANEVLRALAYPKFRLSADEREELLAEYLPWCEVITVPSPPPKVPACRDPKDRMFLELAAAARADCLISGDDDLQALADAFKIPILSPAVLRQQLGI
jgi:uncharacterized protein